VISRPLGAVPEVVEGVNGFHREEVDELIEAVDHAALLDPRHCRGLVEARFSSVVTVDGYERLYRSRVEPSRHRYFAQSALDTAGRRQVS
jgi:hypothetical protein